MRKRTIYNVDGKKVEEFSAPKHASLALEVEGKKHALSISQAVQYLNRQGFYVRGQTTSKGVKIK